MTKPDPMPHVYNWVALHDWLRAEAPAVAEEVRRMVEGWEEDNGHLHHVHLDDYEEGLHGDLSSASIAWLKEHVAPVFALWVWW